MSLDDVTGLGDPMPTFRGVPVSYVPRLSEPRPTGDEYMKIMLALALLLPLSGCGLLEKGLDYLPQAVDAGAELLSDKLAEGVSELTNGELRERLAIMQSLSPAVESMADVSAEYQAALEAEAARRGL